MPHRHHGRAQSVDISKLRSVQRKRSYSASDGVPKSPVRSKNAAPQVREQSLEQNDTIEVLDSLFAQHAQDLEEERLKYEKLQAEFEKLSKEARRLREQRDNACARLEVAQQQQTDLEHHRENLQRRCDSVHAMYKHIVQKAITPFAKAHRLRWNNQTAETMAMVLEPLAADAVEACELRNQVATLQNEMLAKRDKVNVISDDQLAQEFRNLATLVKSVTRIVRPKQGVNIVEATTSTGLLQGVDRDPWGVRTRKKFLIEAWIWSVLCDCVFSHPFGWFGQEGHDLSVLWMSIFTRDVMNVWPIPTSLSETWRSTTAAQLAQQLNPKAMSEGLDHIDESFRNVDFSVINYRAHVYSIIMSVLSTFSGVTDIPQVRSIVDNAFAFALQMSLQRVRLQVTYPCAGALFDQNTMQPMADPDDDDEEEAIKDGIVSFILNPGLAKWGNAHGKDVDQRFDIVKAAVKLEKSGPQEGISLI